MNISVFLSNPKPSYKSQEEFLMRVRQYLEQRGLNPRTLGVTDYDMNAPLTGIRRLMLESNGLIAVAFRRTYISQGTKRHQTDLPDMGSEAIDDSWLTTPWSHIEAAMAYQIGLPILILKEKGVIADGILERGVVGLYVPEFDPTMSMDQYFASPEWNMMMGKWECRVRSVADKKGRPPVLFDE